MSSAHDISWLSIFMLMKKVWKSRLSNAGYFPGELQTKPIIIERKPTVVKEQKHFGEILETAMVSSDKGERLYQRTFRKSLQIAHIRT